MKTRVREERKRREMTQQDLAVAAGISISTVARVERGQGAELATARKIAVALETTVDELFPAEAA